MKRILTAAPVLAALSQAVSAAPILTQDPAAFVTATAGLTFTTETFDALPEEFSLASKDLGDFTVVPAAGVFHIADVSACRSGTCLFGLDTGVTLTFDSPVSALGFYLGEGRTDGSDVVVDGTSAGSITTPFDGFTFVGIYDPAGTFSTVSLPGDVFAFDVDDLSYARPAATAVVPLPATLPLLAGATLLLTGLRRRR